MSEDPQIPAVDVPALQQQLDQANQRLLHAELKSHAIRAGIIDLDGLKLLDTSGLKLDESGNLPDGAEALARLKREKPWLFAKPNTSHPAPPPPAEPPALRTAKQMSVSEWKAARARLISGR